MVTTSVNNQTYHIICLQIQHSICQNIPFLAQIGHMIMLSLLKEWFQRLILSLQFWDILWDPPATSITSIRSSTNVSEAGVPRCFSSSHCRCYFLGPLVPPCNKLLSKSGNDCRPDLTCARVTVGHDRFTMAETVSESLVVSNSSQSIGIQIQLLLPYINLPVSSSVFRHHATHAIAWGPVVQGGFLPMGIVNWHFFLTGA